MRHLRSLLIPLLGGAILAGGLPLYAQSNVYSPDQINQMVAPIALYPDALGSQVLMASTYPTQVIEADRWVQANPGLAGDSLDQALATATWDPSAISLCKFPTVLDRMAQNITWTTDLGNAFLYQRTDVMNAVQDLRSAAYENGTLRTSEQNRVVIEGSDIVIQPTSPEVIYVPSYQPAVVYGSYWSYPYYYYPRVWDPWPGYSFVNGFAWGAGYFFGNILFGGFDWGHHDVWMDYGAIHGCSLYAGSRYHNSHYRNERHGGGRHGRQRWNHHSGVDYASGGTGQPYGGRSSGRINGVTAGHAVRRAEPAVVTGSRGDAGRGSNLHPQRGRTDDTARGSNRPAAHGPTGWAGQTTSRPAQRGRTDATARGYNRSPVSRPPTYSARGANRPSVGGSSSHSARGYSRPSVSRPSTYPARGANRPTASSPSGSTRSGNSHSSARPSAPSGRASAGSGHASGGRGASGGSRGGQGTRGRR